MSAPMPDIVMSREEAIAKLKSLIPAAKRADKESKRQHDQKKREALTAFRAKCRAAAKLGYEEARKYSGYRAGITLDAPECPTSKVADLNRSIKRLEMDTRKNLTISPRTAHYDVYRWLMWEEHPAPGLCDKD